jgi:hypothetical protein
MYVCTEFRCLALYAVGFPRQKKNEAGAKWSRYSDHAAGFATRELAILYLAGGKRFLFLFAPSKPALLHIISNRRCFPGVKHPRREDDRSHVILLCLHSPVHAVWYFVKRTCVLMNA